MDISEYISWTTQEKFVISKKKTSKLLAYSQLCDRLTHKSVKLKGKTK
jgi:hypothetical protein